MSRVFELPVVVRFADCDAAGIHFFPRYLERVNQTVEEWFERALGCSFKTLHLDWRESVPTARLEADFHAPSRLEDALVYRLSVARLGRASATLRTRIVCGDEQRVEVRHVIVFADLESLKARAWPADLRERMVPFVEEAAA